MRYMNTIYLLKKWKSRRFYPTQFLFYDLVPFTLSNFVVHAGLGLVSEILFLASER